MSKFLVPIRLYSVYNLTRNISTVTRLCHSSNRIGITAISAITTTKTKNYCTEVKKANKESDKSDQPEYIPVYHLKIIKLLSAIAMLKNYQVMITAVAVPSSLTLEMLNIIESGTCLTAFTLGILGIGFLSFYSWRIQNVIGIIYVSRNMDKIKVSYIDFWGRRKDTIIPADDWVPLSEIEHTPLSRFYLQPARYSTNERWKLLHRVKGVLDEDLFIKMLGRI